MGETNIINLCQTNGFTLKEHPLEGRLLVVILPPKIVVRRDLEDKRKQTLVFQAISYLQNSPDCQVAIFWEGEEEFFPL